MGIYYHIKPKQNNENYGIIIKVELGSKKTIETFLGRGSILNICSLSSSGKLVISEKYTSTKISKKKAEDLKSKKKEWDILNNWI